MKQNNQLPEDRYYNFNQTALRNQMLRKSNQESIDETAKHLLENDLSIYQYDEYYEQDKQDKQKINEIKKVEKQKNNSSIIGNLRRAKMKRDREVSISVENVAQSQRKRDGHTDGEDKFVTASYLKVLDENKKYQEQQLQEDKNIEKSTFGQGGSLLKLNQGLLNSGFAGRMDSAEQRKQLEQQAKIDEYLRIKQERLQKRNLDDQNFKSQMNEVYRDQLKKIQEEKQQKEQTQQGIEIENSEHIKKDSRSNSPQESRKKHRKEKKDKKDKKEKKDKKDKKKSHKHSRSRSRSKDKKEIKQKRSESQEKEKASKKERPKVPSFNNQQNQSNKSQEEAPKELTREEKKKLALQKLQERKQKQLEEQQQQEKEKQEQEQNSIQ